MSWAAGLSPMDPSSRPSLAAGARVQIDRLDGQAVLLYPEGALRLDQTAAEILSLCDGQLGMDEIVAVLAERYAAGDSLRADVFEFVSALHARQLIELSLKRIRDE